MATFSPSCSNRGTPPRILEVLELGEQAKGQFTILALSVVFTILGLLTKAERNDWKRGNREWVYVGKISCSSTYGCGVGRGWGQDTLAGHSWISLGLGLA